MLVPLLAGQHLKICMVTSQMLKIKDFHAEIYGKPILKGLSLTVNSGEVYAIGTNNADSMLDTTERRR